MWHSVSPDLSASPRASSYGGGCKVHNSHCCICSSDIFPYYSIYNRSLIGFCGCFTSYIVLINDYVKHLYIYYLLTPVITGIDHIPTLLLNNWVLYSSTCQQPDESQSLLYPLHCGLAWLTVRLMHLTIRFVWPVDCFNSIRLWWRWSRFWTTDFHAASPLGQVTWVKMFCRIEFGRPQMYMSLVLHHYSLKPVLPTSILNQAI